MYGATPARGPPWDLDAAGPGQTPQPLMVASRAVTPDPWRHAPDLDSEDKDSLPPWPSPLARAFEQTRGRGEEDVGEEEEGSRLATLLSAVAGHRRHWPESSDGGREEGRVAMLFVAAAETPRVA